MVLLPDTRINYMRRFTIVHQHKRKQNLSASHLWISLEIFVIFSLPKQELCQFFCSRQRKLGRCHLQIRRRESIATTTTKGLPIMPFPQIQQVILIQFQLIRNEKAFMLSLQWKLQLWFLLATQVHPKTKEIEYYWSLKTPNHECM